MEILAPAGSIAALKAAIKGGANAVYLGLGEHNARIKSNDFTTENLSEWVSYAHLFDVKVYVTLNTAVKSEELDRVISLAKVAAESGADALIVSDLGVVRVLSRITDIPLHLSTQAGVQNSLDAKALEGLRIKRLILARETPIADIPAIKKYVDEIEIFVQGAICVSFSGGCLLGSKMYGASGNRGLCNQACRLTYSALNESGETLKKGKLLSPYDLSLGKEVRKLSALGVDSIKIEGRLKRPLYVYSATKYYRDILDGNPTKEDYRDLCESFNRGFTEGYTLRKSAKIINVKTSAHLGVSVGTVTRVFLKNGYKFASVRSSYPFEKGDGAKILRNGEEIGGSDVTSVHVENGEYVIPVSESVRVGDEVCLTTNHKKVVASESIVNKLPITMELSGSVSRRIRLTAYYGETAVSVESETIAQRSNSSDNVAMIEKLSKVGNTDFEIKAFSDRTDAPLYVGVTELNALRRDLLDRLRKSIISLRTPHYRFDPYVEEKSTLRTGSGFAFEVSDLGSADSFRDVRFFVITPDRYDREGVARTLRKAKGVQCYLRLPKIVRESEMAYYYDLLRSLPEIGVYADNLYAVSLARQLGRGYVVGFGLNVFNEESLAFYSDADHICASVEWAETGDVAYKAGKLPLMSFAHCPFSVVYGKECATCDRAKSKLFYTNGEYRYLILRREGVSCDFTLYEDRITRYPSVPDKIEFYSLIGLKNSERGELMDCISEVDGE